MEQTDATTALNSLTLGTDRTMELRKSQINLLSANMDDGNFYLNEVCFYQRNLSFEKETAVRREFNQMCSLFAFKEEILQSMCLMDDDCFLKSTWNDKNHRSFSQAIRRESIVSCVIVCQLARQAILRIVKTIVLSSFS